MNVQKKVTLTSRKHEYDDALTSQEKFHGLSPRTVSDARSNFWRVVEITNPGQAAHPQTIMLNSDMVLAFLPNTDVGPDGFSHIGVIGQVGRITAVVAASSSSINNKNGVHSTTGLRGRRSAQRAVQPGRRALRHRVQRGHGALRRDLPCWVRPRLRVRPKQPRLVHRVVR